MEEKRRAPRMRAFKAAKIVNQDRTATIDCTVRNLSTRGACLEVLSSIEVPNAFELILETTRSKYPCRVVWRQPTRVGVEFQ
jgi:hypothetical protein